MTNNNIYYVYKLFYSHKRRIKKKKRISKYSLANIACMSPLIFTGTNNPYVIGDTNVRNYFRFSRNTRLG